LVGRDDILFESRARINQLKCLYSAGGMPTSSSCTPYLQGGKVQKVPDASFLLCVNMTYNICIIKSGETAMSASLANESARINLRTSADAKAMIERAAALMGTTVSSFMLQNAYEAARRVVSDYDTLMLTQRDFEAFAASMEKPPKPKAALRKLMARR
jgi:uncharacterized protein (DUF1778 family)